jgi:hypothetical protein
MRKRTTYLCCGQWQSPALALRAIPSQFPKVVLGRTRSTQKPKANRFAAAKTRARAAHLLLEFERAHGVFALLIPPRQHAEQRKRCAFNRHNIRTGIARRCAVVTLSSRNSRWMLLRGWRVHNDCGDRLRLRRYIVNMRGAGQVQPAESS